MAHDHLIIRKLNFESNRSFFGRHNRDRDSDRLIDDLSYDLYDCHFYRNIYIVLLNYPDHLTYQ